MQHAEHAVDIALIDDQLVVIAGLELMQDLLERRVEIERFDTAARDHHVVDGDVFQIEQIQQNATVLGRHETAGFQHDGAQFFGGKPLVAAPFVLMCSTRSTPFANRLTNQTSGRATRIIGANTRLAGSATFSG